MIKSKIGIIIFPSTKNKKSIVDKEKCIPNTNIFINNIRISDFIRAGVDHIITIGDNSICNSRKNITVMGKNIVKDHVKFLDFFYNDNLYFNYFIMLKDAVNDIINRLNIRDDDLEGTNIIVSYMDNVIISSSSYNFFIEKYMDECKDYYIIYGNSNNDKNNNIAYFIFNLKWFTNNILNLKFKNSKFRNLDNYNKELLMEKLKLVDERLQFSNIHHIYTNTLLNRNMYTYYEIRELIFKDPTPKDELRNIYLSSIIEFAMYDKGLISYDQCQDIIANFIIEGEKELISYYRENSTLGSLFYGTLSPDMQKKLNFNYLFND